MAVLSADQHARGGLLLADAAEQRAQLAHAPIAVAQRFAALVRSDLLHLPLPAHGDTAGRFAALSALGAADLSLARLAEGHVDAVAILTEAGHAVPAGRLGVWAADPPDGRVEAERTADGQWLLTGTKQWCSGAGLVDAALITAHAPDGYRLFLLGTHREGVVVRGGEWQAVGMRASATGVIELDGAPVESGEVIGGPGWYLDRAGFWPGGAGVAACWYGGARGLTEVLRDRLTAAHRSGREPDPHRLRELGAATALCDAMEAHLRATAQLIDDAGRLGSSGDLLRRAVWSVRASVERLCLEALPQLERGLGPAALTGDPRAAALAADLPVYLRQHHGGRDLAALGRAAVG